MAVTLAQAKELSQDKLTQQIIDDFRLSPVLRTLPFDNTIKPNGVSLAYAYNRITTQAQAHTRALNSEYTPQETATTQEVTNLKVLGGSFQIDRVIARDEVQVINEIELQTREKVKATRALFNDLFINGDSDTTPTQFDGIKKFAKDTNVHVFDAEGLDVSTMTAINANANELIYAMRKVYKNTEGFTHVGVNADLFAAFQQAVDVVPSVTQTKDEIGNDVIYFGNTEIVGMGQKPGTFDEVIPTRADGTTDMYFWREGLDGVHGVSPQGNDLVEIHYPDFSVAKAVHTGDVELVGGIVCKKYNSVGILENVKVLPGE